MYRFYSILFLLTLSINGFAQKTIDRTTYESVVDQLNCELSKFYMLEEQGKYVQDEYLEYAATHPCSYENLMVFIQGKQPQLENNGYLTAYINEMKDEYDKQPSNSALYNKLVEVFEQELFVKYEANEDFDNLKFQLKENYLKERLRVNEILTDEGITNTDEEGFDLWGWLKKRNLLVAFVSMLILIIVYKMFRWTSKYFNTGDGTMTHYGKNKPSSNVAVQNETPEIAESTQTLNEKLGQAAIASRGIPPQEIPAENQADEVTEPQPLEEDVAARGIENLTDEETEIFEEDFSSLLSDEVVFYMPYPSIDGSFYDSESTEEESPEESRFKFKLVNEKYALAIFEVLSSDKIITDIFMDYEGTIKAVCDIEGDFEDLKDVLKPGLVEIVTVKPGIVRKSSRHWRLKEKAMIRFKYED